MFFLLLLVFFFVDINNLNLFTNHTEGFFLFYELLQRALVQCHAQQVYDAASLTLKWEEYLSASFDAEDFLSKSRLWAPHRKSCCRASKPCSNNLLSWQWILPSAPIWLYPRNSEHFPGAKFSWEKDLTESLAGNVAFSTPQNQGLDACASLSQLSARLKYAAIYKEKPTSGSQK